jgi:hypothetical protein
MTELAYTFSFDDNLDTALEYADCGYPVFPVKVWPDPENPGKFKKKPLTDNGHLDASTDPKRIREMFEDLPWASIARRSQADAKP